MRSSRVTPNTVATPNEWNALREDARAASRLLAHQMYGVLAMPTNPTNGQTVTLTINGNAIVLTAVASIGGAAAGSFLIAGTAALTLANAYALLINPTISNASQVAIGLNTDVNTTLVNYVNWSIYGTNLVASSSNFSLYSPATSFTATTTVTGASYSANSMAFFIEPGVIYVNGTEVYFAGGVTPTVTAPTSHPRIDVLTIDSSGNLAWTTGTENASPSVPTYPANKIPICELYNVTGETALYDNSNQLGGEGYILNDVRPVLSTGVNLAAVPDSIVPSANNTYNLGSPGNQWNNGYFGNAVFVNGTAMAGHFGGTGTDGALTVSSGTTTISAGSAAYLAKNYASLSITGTGYVQFTTPHANGTVIQIKVQGNVTLTSSAAPMLDASGMGAAGASSGATGNGSTGSNSNSNFLGSNSLAGAGGTSASPGLAGSGGTNLPLLVNAIVLGKHVPLICGGGGGSGGGGGGSGGNGGAGGAGGGAVFIECGGSWNFTTASGISVAGLAGTAGNGTAGAGGGGGGGGQLVALYAALTANSGTVTVSGGSGGAQTGGSSQPNGGGGGGGASSANAGSSGSNGGSGSGHSGGAGGNGGNGSSLIEANVDFS